MLSLVSPTVLKPGQVFTAPSLMNPEVWSLPQ